MTLRTVLWFHSHRHTNTDKTNKQNSDFWGFWSLQVLLIPTLPITVCVPKSKLSFFLYLLTSSSSPLAAGSIPTSESSLPLSTGSTCWPSTSLLGFFAINGQSQAQMTPYNIKDYWYLVLLTRYWALNLFDLTLTPFSGLRRLKPVSPPFCTLVPWPLLSPLLLLLTCTFTSS